MGQTGRTLPHLSLSDSEGYPPVDVAAWGATLIRRQVVESGHLPDGDLFFGYEDFDFFLRLREAGWRVVVDAVSEHAVLHQVTDQGRSQVLGDMRPTDAEEPWRNYYRARNFLIMQRRWGTWRWGLDHLLHSVRRWQLASWHPSVGAAIAQGL